MRTLVCDIALWTTENMTSPDRPPNATACIPVQENHRETGDTPVEHIFQTLPDGFKIQLLHDPDAFTRQTLEHRTRRESRIIRHLSIIFYGECFPPPLSIVVEHYPLIHLDHSPVK